MAEKDDEMALAPFFAAVRAAEPEPRIELLSTILGDAAEVSATRAPPARAAAGRTSRRRDGALLAGLGGWRAAAALATCAALGLVLGLAGAGDVAGVPLGTSATAAASDAPADPVADFYDLASTEG